MLLVHSER